MNHVSLWGKLVNLASFMISKHHEIFDEDYDCNNSYILAKTIEEAFEYMIETNGEKNLSFKV